MEIGAKLEDGVEAECNETMEEAIKRARPIRDTGVDGSSPSKETFSPGNSLPESLLVIGILIRKLRTVNPVSCIKQSVKPFIVPLMQHVARYPSVV